jgi:hypothetical protein
MMAKADKVNRAFDAWIKRFELKQAAFWSKHRSAHPWVFADVSQNPLPFDARYKLAVHPRRIMGVW